VTEELLTIQEAARRLGLKPKTVRRWAALRKIEFIKAGERAVRISSAEVERIIEVGRTPRLTSSGDEKRLVAVTHTLPIRETRTGAGRP
jgi:excisionase family DNA binding protein